MSTADLEGGGSSVGLRKRIAAMTKEQLEDELFRVSDESVTLKKRLRSEEDAVKKF